MTIIAPGVTQIDTLLGGFEGMTAGFLIGGSAPALLEPGAQTSAKTVVAALDAQGVERDTLAWIIVSHIHLDHAGAAGDLAILYPKATVVVHREGARHLIDPTRLVASAGRVYGDLLDTLYGRMTPIPSERVLAVSDGDRILVDGPTQRHLRIIESPGHARHHIAVLDEETGVLIAGDAVGVKLGKTTALRPAAPPPEFDWELAIESLHRFDALHPERLVLAHYGVMGDVHDTLVEAEEALTQWVEIARSVTKDGADPNVTAVEAAFRDAFSRLPHGMSPQELERMELLNGLASNATGITRYLTKRHEAKEHA